MEPLAETQARVVCVFPLSVEVKDGTFRRLMWATTLEGLCRIVTPVSSAL